MSARRTGVVPGDAGQDESGAITAEQVAVLLVVAAVVAALVAASVPQTVGEWGRYAACSLFSSDDCERPGGLDGEPELASPWLPQEPCTIGRSIDGWESSVGILLVGAAGDAAYIVEERSDGTWMVTWTSDGGIGLGANAGIMLEVSTGDEDWGTGVYAGADARFTMGNSETWAVGSAEEALEWIAWHDRMLAPAESLDTPLQWLNPMTWGGSDSIQGRTHRWSAERVNDVLNAFGGGLDEPTLPETLEIFHSGGFEVEAEAYGGFVFGADASAGIEMEGQLGWSELPQTGERRYYYAADASMLLHAGLNTADGADGRLDITSVLAVTVDASGVPTSLDATFTTFGDADQTFEGVTDPRDVLGSVWDGRAGDGRDARSLYEVDVSVALDGEYDSLGDVLLQLGPHAPMVGGTGGRVGLGDALWERGTVAVTEYAVDDRRYGGRAGVGLEIHVAGAVHKVESDMSARRSHFYDREAGAYTPRLDCQLG